MRVHIKNGQHSIELTKLEELSLSNCACLLKEMARYPEDYPRAAAASEMLAKLKEPMPTEKK